MSIQIAILDDHTIFRTGVKNLIESTSNNKVHYEFAHPKAFLESKDLHNIHVLLLDLSLPDMTGIEVLKHCHSLGFKGKIVCLTMFEEKEYGIDCF